jgi:hypothetical protein
MSDGWVKQDDETTVVALGALPEKLDLLTHRGRSVNKPIPNLIPEKVARLDGAD